jgi:hypothetical protein
MRPVGAGIITISLQDRTRYLCLLALYQYLPNLHSYRTHCAGYRAVVKNEADTTVARKPACGGATRAEGDDRLLCTVAAEEGALGTLSVLMVSVRGTQWHQ